MSLSGQRVARQFNRVMVGLVVLAVGMMALAVTMQAGSQPGMWVSGVVSGVDAIFLAFTLAGNPYKGSAAPMYLRR